MKRHMTILLALALAAACFAGCSDDDDDSNPAGPSTGSGIAVVNTGGDDEANLSVIDFRQGTAWNDLLPLAGTSELARFGDHVYIVDKSGDRVIRFDPVERAVLGEFSTGPGSAPNSIVFASSEKAYVTLADSAAVKIVDPTAMTVTGSIDISSMADSDGDPDQDHAVIRDGKLYVALRRSSGRSLNDYSSLAVIDIASDTVAGEIVLATNGIAGASKFAIGGGVQGQNTVAGNLYPYVVGSISDPADGAIEIVDTAAMTTDLLMTETAIGGNITIWVFDSNTTGWAIAGLSDRSGGEGWGLRRFDLAAGTFTPVSSFQKAYYSWALDFSADGLVLVGSSNEDNPGVWVFDSADGYAPLFEKPIDTGLLPERILVVR